MTDTVNVEHEDGHSPIYEAALATIRKGAPGLSEETCKVLARSINMKVSMPAAAPKVEQEPYGWDHKYRQLEKGEIVLASDEVQHDGGSWHPCTCVGREAPDPSYTSHRVYRRLKCPAPASDELLEAIAKDAAERVHKNGGCVPQLAYAPILFALQDGFAKHKGPQS